MHGLQSKADSELTIHRSPQGQSYTTNLMGEDISRYMRTVVTNVDSLSGVLIAYLICAKEKSDGQTQEDYH
jgi:hypothetical protein